MQIITVTFEEILPLWANKLWPGRISPIETHSAMKFLGGYDMSYFEYPACFILAKVDGVPIGCLSGHATGSLWYRSRGLWVDEHFRRNSVAASMMKKLFLTAQTQGCQWIWTVPRVSSMPFYQNQGFVRASEDFDRDMEFGPNCYAARILC